jgi:hypothetical protein
LVNGGDHALLIMTLTSTAKARMDDQPGHKCVELLQVHGEGLLYDPARLEAMLRAQCPDNRPEIAAIMNAWREGIPAALRAAPSTDTALLAQWRVQLQANQGMQAEAASWAVDVWKHALSGTARTSAAQVSAPQEKLEAKEVLGLIQALALLAVVGFFCLFLFIQVFPPVLGFFLDLKTEFLSDFRANNYAGMIGKTVIAGIAGGDRR